MSARSAIRTAKFEVGKSEASIRFTSAIPPNSHPKFSQKEGQDIDDNTKGQTSRETLNGTTLMKGSISEAIDPNLASRYERCHQAVASMQDSNSTQDHIQAQPRH